VTVPSPQLNTAEFVASGLSPATDAAAFAENDVLVSPVWGVTVSAAVGPVWNVDPVSCVS
jgi:hypothetical protein